MTEVEFAGHVVGSDDVLLLSADVTEEEAEQIRAQLPDGLRGRILICSPEIEFRTLSVPGLDPREAAQVITDVLHELQVNAEASDVYSLAYLRANVGQRLIDLSKEDYQ